MFLLTLVMMVCYDGGAESVPLFLLVKTIEKEIILGTVLNFFEC